jgi:hypothetical protein
VTVSPERASDPLSAPTGRVGDPAWYTRRFELGLYVLAGTTYVVLGVFNKWLLNWIIGPIWLVGWIWAAPAVIDRFRRAQDPPS